MWRARQRTLDRPVAVKVDDRTLDTEVERRRFVGEAKAAGNLSGHPGIVTVHDAGILPDGRPFLVMKLCSGGSLTSWLRPEKRQSAERICSVGARIADALAVAHAQGMLHRDVKPANILIDSYGNPGLADFGLAAPEPGSDASMTVAYAPPEVILGEAPTAAGDVYQLAATMYALLAGRPPSESRGSPASLADRLARLKDPAEPVPGVDEDLMRVVLDGLAFSPAIRPTAAQYRDRLAAITAAHEDANREGSSGMWPVRRRVGKVVLTLVAAALVSLLVVMLGASSVYLYEIDRSVTANIRREIDLPPEQTGGEKRPVKAPEAVQALDYLLIGTDEGDPGLDSDGPSDSIMLVHLNEARDEGYVISVPRNTLVEIPGQPGVRRINGAYPLGGAPLVVRTMERLTSTRIDHAAMIDFQGFVGLTKDLDGITVQNRNPFSSHGYNYPAGNVILTGEGALWYVRARQLPKGELDRAENQRNVIKAILAKGLSPEVVADPFQFTTFLGNAAKRIKVDKGMTNAELRFTATSLRMKPDNVTLISLPTEKKERSVKGQRGYAVDRVQLAELSQALRTDTMADYVKKYAG